MTAPRLLQAAIGIGIALWRLRHEKAAPPIEDGVAPTAKAWAGWREFRVDSTAFEDDACSQRSLTLVPVVPTGSCLLCVGAPAKTLVLVA